MNALGGGIGLVINGLGIPKAQLEDTPFDSFVVPGLFLAIVVGGTMLGAAWATWRRSLWADEATLLAGGTMLGWIIIESGMIHDGRPLQAAIALLALLTLVLGGIRMRFWPARG